MTTIRVAAGALNQTALDWEGNVSRIVESIRAAADQGVGLLCLPELCISGYGCEDGFHSSGTWQTSLEMLVAILPETRGMCVTVGLPIFVNGALYNAAAILVDGRIAGFVPKQNLAGDGVHYEPRWFKPWPQGAVAEIEVEGVDYPVGDLMFEIGGVRIGFEICEDAWVYDRPGSVLARRGVDIICNPSASHFAFDKAGVRNRFVVDGSRAFGCVYVYSNLLGNEAGRMIYDGHTIIASGGTLHASGRRFSFKPYTLTIADVDLNEIRSTRARSANYQPVHSREGVHEYEFQWPEASLETETSDVLIQRTQEDEFTQAVCLGLRDYAVKSGSRGFVVSLSGGADSSAVVALIAAMVEIGGGEIGFEELGVQLGLGDSSSADAIVRQILTTAYQSTCNSSEQTRHAAQVLAEAVGAIHHEIDVDAINQSYIQAIEAVIGRGLTWENDDIALQNIQARVRSPGVWLLANIENKILLTTSNRSEAAVGYATMDGDTSGGLAPIAGIDKAFLRRWLGWMETTGPVGGRPIPELRIVNALVPTAELRPHDHSQTDEHDLMPYPVLDAIEEAFIGRKLSPARVLDEICRTHAMYTRADLAGWLKRFLQLWSRNQWKRERYAPAFHVDDRNLDPKTWCRFPILSGGFRREISNLDTELSP